MRMCISHIGRHSTYANRVCHVTVCRYARESLRRGWVSGGGGDGGMHNRMGGGGGDGGMRVPVGGSGGAAPGAAGRRAARARCVGFFLLRLAAAPFLLLAWVLVALPGVCAACALQVRPRMAICIPVCAPHATYGCVERGRVWRYAFPYARRVGLMDMSNARVAQYAGLVSGALVYFARKFFVRDAPPSGMNLATAFPRPVFQTGSGMWCGRQLGGPQTPVGAPAGSPGVGAPGIDDAEAWAHWAAASARTHERMDALSDMLWQRDFRIGAAGGDGAAAEGGDTDDEDDFIDALQVRAWRYTFA